jgi:uncharacterized protein YqkB
MTIKYHQRTVEFHPDMMVILNDLQKKLGLKSHAEVLQKSVQLMKAVVDRRVYLEKQNDPDKIEELLIK